MRRATRSTNAMTTARTVHIGNIAIGNDKPMMLIAGPCQLESRQHALEMSQALVEMTGKLGMGLIYKTSFDKANRTSARRAARTGSRQEPADHGGDPRDLWLPGADRCP